MFHDQLALFGNRLLVDAEVPPDDLAPPADVEDTVELLRKVLSSAESFTGGQSTEGASEAPAELDRILDLLLTPLFDMCAACTEGLMPGQRAVFTLNCAHRVQSALALYDGAARRAAALEAQMEAHLQLLVQEQARSLLQRSGLGDVMLQLQGWESEDAATRGMAAAFAGLDAQTLQNSMAAFDKFLAAADFGLASPCNLLLGGKAREAVAERAVRYFLGLYGRLHGAVTATGSGYAAPAALVRRAPEQVEALLR